MAKKSLNALRQKRRQRQRTLRALFVFAVLLMAFGLGLLLVWQGTTANRTELSTPTNIRIYEESDKVYLSFSSVANASSYIVNINDISQSIDGKNTKVDITAFVQELGRYNISVQAIGGNFYKNSDVSEIKQYETHLLLENPQPQLEISENLIAWPVVDRADYYEITVNNDNKFVVETNEFDFSDVMNEIGKVYDVSIVARSDNEFILSSDSASSKKITICIAGTMATPNSISFNEETKIFSWNEVENAKSYTVYLEYVLSGVEPVNSEIRVENATSIDLSTYLQSRGGYTFCVRTNGYTIEGTDTVYSASAKSSKYTYNIYQKLPSPQNLTYSFTASDVLFNWDNIENSNGYLFEILNDDDEVYYAETCYTNSTIISRSISLSLASLLRVRVSALGGVNYFTASNPSNIVSLDATDKMAAPEDLTVREDGGRKILTFSAVAQNERGTVEVLNHNGYVIIISKLASPINGGYYHEFLEETFTVEINSLSPSIDITDYLYLPGQYKINAYTRAYSYFEESNLSQDYEFTNILPASAPSITFISEQIDNFGDAQLTFTWQHVADAPNYELLIHTDLDGDIKYNLHIDYAAPSSQGVVALMLEGDTLNNNNNTHITESNQADPHLIWFWKDDDGNIYLNFGLSFYFSQEKFGTTQGLKDGYDIKAFGQSIYATVRVLGQFDSSEPQYFYSSQWASMAQYKNYVQLSSPQIIKIEKQSDTYCELRFSAVEHASYYVVQVESEDGRFMRTESAYTSLNVLSLLFPGLNKISVMAIGSDYYTNSPYCTPVDFTYTMTLQAPFDATIFYDESLDKYFISFTTTRFAEYYKVQIRLADNRSGATGNDYEVLSQNFIATANTTLCDITDYIVGNGFGLYQAQIQANSSNSNALASVWSNIASYTHSEKLVSPQNFMFDEETKTLLWDGNIYATAGYTIEILSNNITYSRVLLDNQLNIQYILDTQDNIGIFSARVLANAVPSQYYIESDWSTIEFAVVDKLASPYNFIFDEENKILSWLEDGRADYSTFVITFCNYEVEETEIYSVDNSINYQYNLFDFSSLFENYGYGWFKITVSSHSNNDLLISSEPSEYTAINYQRLDAPTLISVEGEKGGENIIVSFSPVQFGNNYSVLAKGIENEDYFVVLSNISGELVDENNVIVVDIYNYLSAYLAGEYSIAVRADGYDFFKTSNLSNSIAYKMYLKHAMPTDIEFDEETNTLSWASITTAETYGVAVVLYQMENNKITKKSTNSFPSISTTEIDLTNLLKNFATGLIEVYVWVNENADGYYLQSDSARYEYIKAKQITAPTITYYQDTKTLVILGDTSINYGYSLSIAFNNGVDEEKVYNVEYVTSTSIPLIYLFNDYGIGHYEAKVKQLGDGTYWLTSEESNVQEIDYILPMSSPKNLNIEKVRQGEAGNYTYSYLLSFEKALDNDYLLTHIAIFDLTALNIEPESFDVADLENNYPIATFITKQNENINLKNSIVDSHYYYLSAYHLGLASDSSQIYYGDTTILTNEEFLQVENYITYLTNSDEVGTLFSTYGTQLQTPIIVAYEFIAENNKDYLVLTIKATEHAEDYSVSITRKSDNGVIFSDANYVPSILNASNQFEIKANCNGENSIYAYSDIFDGYEITIVANAVYEGIEVAFQASLPLYYTIDHITKLPTINIENIDIRKEGNELVISVPVVSGVQQYVAFININGATYERMSANGIWREPIENLGKYIVQVQLKGKDAWHLDSDISEPKVYQMSLVLDAIDELRLITEIDAQNRYTRVYVEWDAIENAVTYSVRIQKGTSASYLYYQTTFTTFDLLDIVNQNGWGYYTIWVKTNDVNDYILGQVDYAARVSFNYRLTLTTPSIIGITSIETDTEISYTMEFTPILNAERYTLYAYDFETGGLLDSLVLNSADLQLNDNGNYIFVADDYLKNVPAGKYTLTIKANETETHNQSNESEPYDFEHWKKYSNANLNIDQTENALIKVSFNYYDNDVLYSLLINNAYYTVRGQTRFTYPSVISLSSLELIVGSTNTFKLTVWGSSETYMLDTIFEAELERFVFKLDTPTILSVEQQDETVVAFLDSSQIIINFQPVSYATSYLLNVYSLKNNIYTNLGVSQSLISSGENISQCFANLLPGMYYLTLTSVDNGGVLINSNPSAYYEFNYLLKLKPVENISVNAVNNSGVVNISWAEPSNLLALNHIASINHGELDTQKYLVEVYYKATSTKIYSYTTSDTSLILQSPYVEPGAFTVYITALTNKFIVNSVETALVLEADAVSQEYEYFATLSAPTNLNVYESNGSQYLRFDAVITSYIYSTPSVHYIIYVNGNEILQQATTSSGFNITKYLHGGENKLSVKALSDSAYLLESPMSSILTFIYNDNFSNISSLDIEDKFISSNYYEQRLVFAKPSKLDLNENDIQSLKYILEVQTTRNGITTNNTFNNIIAEVYNSNLMAINVTAYVNNTIGEYVFRLKADAYSVEKLINDFSLTVSYGASPDFVSLTYNYVARANPVTQSAIVAFSNALQRTQDSGEALDEHGLYLYFVPNFSDAEIENLHTLNYVVSINNIEFNVQIDADEYLNSTETYNFGNEIKRYMKVNLYDLLVNQSGGYDFSVPRQFAVKIRSQSQGGYDASIYQNPKTYTYRLFYDTPSNVQYMNIDGQSYLVWECDWTHDSSLKYDSFNLSITSLGIDKQDDINHHQTVGIKYQENELLVADFGTKLQNTNQYKVAKAGDNYTYYYKIEYMLCAGNNEIALFVNGKPSLLYLDSRTITLVEQYVVHLLAPEIELKALETNASTNYSDDIHGAKLTITPTLIRGFNYNLDAAYEIVVTSNRITPIPNSSSDQWENYSLRLQTNLTINHQLVVKYFDGEAFVDSFITGSYNTSTKQITLLLPFDLPAVYSVKVQALGSDELFTTSSDFCESLLVALTYAAPLPELEVQFLVDGVVRSENERSLPDEIEIHLNSDLVQDYYGYNYNVEIYLIDKDGKTILITTLSSNIPTISLKDFPAPNGSSLENLFEYIVKLKGTLVFKAWTDEISKPIAPEASESLILYTQSDIVQYEYFIMTQYYLVFDQVQDFSIQEIETETTLNYVLRWTKVADADSAPVQLYKLRLYPKNYNIDVYNRELIFDELSIYTYEILLSDENLILAGNSYFIDLTSVFNTYNLADYLATIQAVNHELYAEGYQSEPVLFNNAMKWANPNLRIEQDGFSQSFDLYFDNADNNIRYTLSYNGKTYFVQGSSTYAYPHQPITFTSEDEGIVFGRALFNQFMLKMHADSTLGMRETIYRAEYEFIFQLSSPTITNVLEENENILPNATNGRILLYFDSVSHAEQYVLYINGQEQNIHITSSCDISSCFVDRMPGVYELQLVSRNYLIGLVDSIKSEIYNFNFTLRLNPASDLVTAQISNDTLNLSWYEPSNLNDFAVLSQRNGITLSAQTYQIKLYYVLSTTEVLLNNSYFTVPDIVSGNVYNLLTLFSEPGTYRVEVWALKNGPFLEAINCGETSYTYIYTLPSPTNIQLDSESGVVTFTPITLPSYTFITSNIRYRLFINGELIVGALPNGDGYNAYNVFFGGENIIRLQAYDLYLSNILVDSAITPIAKFDMTKHFANIVAYDIEQKYVGNEYRQYFYFDEPSELGLNDNDINNLYYHFVVEHSFDDSTYTTIFDNDIQVLLLSNGKRTIDITSLINKNVGDYKFKISVNDYSTTLNIESTNLRVTYLASSTTEVNYTHKETPVPIQAYDYVVYDASGIRVNSNGQRITRFDIYFPVLFTDSYVQSQNELYYRVKINDSEYDITIYPATDLEVRNIGKCAKYNLFDLISQTVDIAVPDSISIKVRSLEQDDYLASSYGTASIDYTYNLRFEQIEIIDVFDNSQNAQSGDYYFLRIKVPSESVAFIRISFTSRGVNLNQVGDYDPHGTMSKTSTFSLPLSNWQSDLNNTTSAQIFYDEVNKIYYIGVDIYVFAGYNSVAVTALGVVSLGYLDSYASSTNEPFQIYARIATPTLSLNTSSTSNATANLVNRGMNVVISGNLNNGVDYNTYKCYEITITSTTGACSIYAHFSIVQNKSDGVITATEYDDNQFNINEYITFTNTANARQFSLFVNLSMPDIYKVSIRALGQSSMFTQDSAVVTQTIQLVYNVPMPEISVIGYSINSYGVEVERRSSNSPGPVLSNMIITLSSDYITSLYPTTFTLQIDASKIKTSLSFPNITGRLEIDFKNNIYTVINENGLSQVYNGNFGYVMNALSLSVGNIVFKAKTEEIKTQTLSGEYKTIFNSSAEKTGTYVYTIGLETPEDIEIIYNTDVSSDLYGYGYLKWRIGSTIKYFGLQNEVQFRFTTTSLSQQDYKGSLSETKNDAMQFAGTFDQSKYFYYDDNYFYYIIDKIQSPQGIKMYAGLNSITLQAFDPLNRADASDVATKELGYIKRLDTPYIEDVQVKTNSAGVSTGFTIKISEIPFSYKQNNNTLVEIIEQATGETVYSSNHTGKEFDSTWSNAKLGFYEIRVYSLGEIAEISDVPNLSNYSGAQGYTINSYSFVSYIALLSQTLPSLDIYLGSRDKGSSVPFNSSQISYTQSDMLQLTFEYSGQNEVSNSIILKVDTSKLNIEFLSDSSSKLKMTLRSQITGQSTYIDNILPIATKFEGENAIYLELQTYLRSQYGYWSIYITPYNDREVYDQEHSMNVRIYNSDESNSNTVYCATYFKLTNPVLVPNSSSNVSYYTITNHIQNATFSNAAGQSIINYAVYYVGSNLSFYSYPVNNSNGSATIYLDTIYSEFDKLTTVDAGEYTIYVIAKPANTNGFLLESTKDEENGFDFEYKFKVELPTIDGGNHYYSGSEIKPYKVAYDYQFVFYSASANTYLKDLQLVLEYNGTREYTRIISINSGVKAVEGLDIMAYLPALAQKTSYKNVQKGAYNISISLSSSKIRNIGDTGYYTFTIYNKTPRPTYISWEPKIKNSAITATFKCSIKAPSDASLYTYINYTITQNNNSSNSVTGKSGGRVYISAGDTKTFEITISVTKLSGACTIKFYAEKYSTYYFVDSDTVSANVTVPEKIEITNFALERSNTQNNQSNQYDCVSNALSLGLTVKVGGKTYSNDALSNQDAIRYNLYLYNQTLGKATRFPNREDEYISYKDLLDNLKSYGLLKIHSLNPGTYTFAIKAKYMPNGTPSQFDQITETYTNNDKAFDLYYKVGYSKKLTDSNMYDYVYDNDYYQGCVSKVRYLAFRDYDGNYEPVQYQLTTNVDTNKDSYSRPILGESNLAVKSGRHYTQFNLSPNVAYGDYCQFDEGYSANTLSTGTVRLTLQFAWYAHTTAVDFSRLKNTFISFVKDTYKSTDNELVSYNACQRLAPVSRVYDMKSWTEDSGFLGIDGVYANIQFKWSQPTLNQLDGVATSKIRVYFNAVATTRTYDYDWVVRGLLNAALYAGSGPIGIIGGTIWGALGLADNREEWESYDTYSYSTTSFSNRKLTKWGANNLSNGILLLGYTYTDLSFAPSHIEIRTWSGDNETTEQYATIDTFPSNFSKYWYAATHQDAFTGSNANTIKIKGVTGYEIMVIPVSLSGNKEYTLSFTCTAPSYTPDNSNKPVRLQILTSKPNDSNNEDKQLSSSSYINIASASSGARSLTFTTTTADKYYFILNFGYIKDSNTTYSFSFSNWSLTTPKVCTITFNANGGTGTMTSQEGQSGKYIWLNKNEYSKENCDFIGWNTNKSATTALYTDCQRIQLTENITLYAIWKQDTSSITKTIFKVSQSGSYYRIDGLTSYGKTQTTITIATTLTDGDNKNKVVKFISSGAFSGETSIKTLTFSSSNITSIPENLCYGCTSLSSITLGSYITYIGENAFYGCSSLKSITIPSQVTKIETSAFKSSGLTSASLSNKIRWCICYDDYDIEEGEVIQKILTDNEKNTSGFANLLKSNSYSDNSVRDYYFYKYPSDFTLSFNANGGSGTMTSQSGFGNTTIKTNAFARSGYIFKGWATYSGGSVSYNDGATIELLFNRTLYAVWEKDGYDVNIVYKPNYSNSGYNDVPQKETGVKQFTFKGNIFSRSGYALLGWSTSSSATTATYGLNSTITISSNFTGKTLYAVWKKTSFNYKIVYDENTGAWFGVKKITDQSSGASVTIRGSSTFSRDGYTLKGWSTSSGQNNSVSSSYSFNKTITLSSDLDLTLYAVWQAKTYNVTLNRNGGSGGSSTVTVTYDKAMPKLTSLPTKTNYDFQGYFSSTSGGTKYYNADGSSARNWDLTSNTTLYAQWKEKSSGGGICIVEGTKITLANGTAKNVENISYSDLLLTWNSALGRYDYSYSMWIEKGTAYDTYQLTTFDDGTILKTYGSHSVFSVDANKFVDVIDESNFHIGTTVFKHKAILGGGCDYDEYNKIAFTTAKVVSIEYVTDNFDYYFVATSNYYNTFANGILTSEPLTVFSNLFYFDEDMKRLEDLRENYLQNNDFISLQDFDGDVPDYLFYSLNIKEWKYGVLTGRITLQKIIDFMVMVSNKNIVTQPTVVVNESEYRVWCITTSDEWNDIFSEEYSKSQYLEGDYYTFSTPINIIESKTFKGWRLTNDVENDRLFQVGDTIQVWYSMHFEAVWE